MLALLLSAAVWLNVAAPPTPAALSGRVLVVHLWRPDDPSERGVLEALKRLQQEPPAREGRVAVLAEASGLSAARLREAAAREEVAYPVGLDAAAAASRALEAAPGSVVLVSADGQVARTLSPEEAAAQVESAAAKLAQGLKPRPPLAARLEPRSGGVLLSPGGLAADDAAGRVYVSDTGHDRLLVLDARGKLLETVGAGLRGYQDDGFADSLFDRPRALALMGHGLVVAESERGRLRWIDLERREVRTFDTPPLALPTGVAASRTDAYFSLPGARTIRDFDMAAGHSFVYAGSGDAALRDGALPAAGFPSPAALAFDQGALYVADSSTGVIRRIEVSAPEVETLPARLPGPPAALAVSSGTVYAALADGRLFAFDRKAAAPRLIASGLRDPQALAVFRGELLVAEAGAGRVSRLTRQGRRLGRLSLRGARARPPAPAPPPSPKRRALSVSGGPLRAGAKDALRLRVRLPKGWVLHPNAPFSYRVAEASGEVLFDPATRKAVELKPKTSALIRLTSLPGTDQAAIEADYSYCPASLRAPCRTDSARVLATVEVSSSAAARVFDVTIAAP